MLAAKLRLVDAVRDLANEKDVSAGQLALAWVSAQGEDVVPIPGTKRRNYLEEDAAARELVLTSADLDLLAEAVPVEAVTGDRYPDMRTVER